MGLWDKFKSGLESTKSFLMDELNRIAVQEGIFDEAALDELEELFIRADMGGENAMRLMDGLRQAMIDEKDNSRSFVVSYLKQGIKELLGPKKTLDIRSGQLNILLMIGVNGTGKTTTVGKLAHRFNLEGKRVVIGAADTFRAAAIDQLKHWAQATGSGFIQHPDQTDPASVVFDSIRAAQARKADILLIDTAGRLHNKKNLMDELEKMRRIISREAPDANCQTLLVIDATTGQNAVIQAKLFSEVAQVDGLIITKLDGSSKGGVAIAVAGQVKLPIFMAGLGEGVDDLVDFDPDIFIDSLLSE